MSNDRGDQTTTSELKIQIRRKDGKIFGPYARREVLAFIYSKKLDGSESILFEGSDRWRAINSDTEFFDALQEVLFGIKPDLAKKNKTTKVQSPNTTFSERPDLLSENHDAVTKISSSSSDQTSAKDSKDQTTQKKEVTVLSKPKAPTKVKEEPRQESLGIQSNQTITETVRSQLEQEKAVGAKSASKANQKRFFVYGLVVILILVSWFTQKGHHSPASRMSNQGVDAMIGDAPAYFRPLLLRYKNLAELKFPLVPDNLKSSNEFSLPQGFGAHVFTEEVEKFVALQADQRNFAEQWVRFAWSLKWLGKIISVYSVELGNELVETANKTFNEVSQKTKISPDIERLFGQIENISDGNLSEAQKQLMVSTDEHSRWLLAEVAWLRYWKKEITADEWMQNFGAEKFNSTLLESSYQVKKLFFQKSPETVFWLDQLSLEDPSSLSLWFVAGEYYWRVQSTFLQKSYLFWVSGLGAASLYPKSFQAVYHEQMATLIKLFGRQVPAQKLEQNAAMISSGDIASNVQKWNPIFGEVIDVDQLTDEILDSGASQRLAPIRLATLQNLSFTVSRRGGRKLLQVGYYWIFEKNYKRALETFDSAIAFEDAKAESWGAKVWLHAERFEFDRAISALEKIKTQPGAGGSIDLYDAILHYFARDFDYAKTKFEQFLKASPGSGLGHYFYARLLETQEKNIDCAKAAFLGGSNGVGEVGLRSRLLFYRCRILAGLQISGALSDLEKMYQNDPGNTAAVIEYVRGLSNAQLSDKSIAVGREAVEKFPRSYELRLALGDAYLKAREYDKALAFYNNARRFRPEAAEAFIKIAELLIQQDRHQEAAENFRVAAQLNKEYPEAWLKAAQSYRKSGNKDEAIFAYTKELEARPSVLQTFIEMSEYLLELSMPQAVLDLFQKYQSSFNDDPRVAIRLSQAYMGLQNFEKARERAAFAQSRLPTYPEPYRILGLIADMEGNYPSAKRHLGQYLKLIPQAEDADAIRQKLEQPPYTNE